MGKNKVVKTPGWWLLRAFIKDPQVAQEYSEKIRRLPYGDRRWCRKLEAWAIRRAKNTNKFVVNVSAKYLGIKVKV